MQILIPAVPRMANDLGVSYAAAQLSLTLYLLGLALGQLLYGPLADRYGRRPVLLWSFGLYLVASVLSALAPGMASLGIGRLAQAIGACSGMVLGRAIIRDVWPREEAASRIGYVVMAMTVAPMLAPIVGALIEERFGWRAALAACLIFGSPLLLAVWRRLPETLHTPQPLPGLRGMGLAYFSLLRLPAFLWIGAIGACATAVFFTFQAGAPRVVQEMGHPPRVYATASLLVFVGYAAGSWLAGRYSARLGLVRMLSAGLWMIILGAGGMLGAQLLLPPSLAGFFLPMTVVAVGNGVAMPNAVAGAISVRPERAATASGLLGALQMGSGAVLTLLTGAVEGGTGVATALAMAGCGIGAIIALWGARRHL
jgi:DHA1 family bicyclomycin/chloramphenicol resistance-like MFS transporter